MADVEFVPDHRGLGQLLRGAEVHDLVMDRARAGAQFAQTIAPRRTGEYAAGIHAEDGGLGGPRHDRPLGLIVATAPHSAAVEWATITRSTRTTCSPARSTSWRRADVGIVLPPFPDAETVVMTLLEPAAPTVTATPADLVPPLIRVQRVGGSDDGITDYPRMEIACYGKDRAQAWQLAEQCRQLVLGSVRTHVGGVLIDNARTDHSPTQVSYENADLRRIIAYFRLSWRRSRR
jgi:hypothetical protein